MLRTNRILSALVLFFLGFWLVTSTRSTAATGDADGLNLAIVTGTGRHVSCAIRQPDGKLLLAGNFTTVLGQARSNIARLNADGSLDAGFNPVLNSSVNCLALQPDGKILVGGGFNIVQGQTRVGIARLNSNGTLDTAFDPNPNSAVHVITISRTGFIFIGGTFTSLKPNGAATSTPRNYIARLATDGTVSVTFDPKPNGPVYCMLLQDSDDLVFGGNFTTLAPQGASTPTPRNRIARLYNNWLLDTTFNPNPDNTVHALALQSDGRIILGGIFTGLQPNGAPSSTPRNRIARINADGSLDTGYNPNANNPVTGITLQADGKAIIGGNFTTLQPTGSPSAATRNRIARLNTDGSLDTAFAPNAGASVYGMALDQDGAVMVGGQFLTIGGTTRNYFARLLNDPAADGMDFSSTVTARWSRSGSAPMLTQVIFETSPNGSAPWTLHAFGQRDGTSPNWGAYTGNLPYGTWLRARGRSSGGYYGGSSTMVESAVLQILPRLRISGNGQTITNGDTTPDPSDFTDFGSVTMGSNLTRTFNIANIGPSELTFTGPSGVISGSHAAEFELVPPSASYPSIDPGGSGIYQIRFTPAGQGMRTATVTLQTNDPTANPFTFTVQGTGIRPTASASLSSQAGITNSMAQWIVSGPQMTGLTAANFSLSSTGLGGSPAILSVTPIGPLPSNSWTVTASTGTGDGTISLSMVNDNGLSHTITNLPVSGTNSTVVVDRTPPTVSITLSDTELHPGETSLVTFSFSEPVLNFQFGDFTMPNGTLSTIFETPDSTTTTTLFTPVEGVLDLSNVVTLDNTAFTYLAGNSDSGSTVSANYSVETVTLTPSITSTATNEDTQTAGGLVLTRNPSDTAGEATHFKVTGIANGTIYQNDGVSPVAENTFLTFAEANAGLRFTPAPDFNGSSGFNVQASTTNADAGLRGGVVPVAITVNPVNDPPAFVIGANRTHAAGTASAQSFTDVSTAISDGDPEIAQAIVFNVTNDNAAIFTTLPAIAADGTLSYTPNGTPGMAVVSVSLTDDATAGGAALTTAVQTFTIKVLSAAEIAVSGSTTYITNGDATPNPADHTDFGSLNIADAPVVRTFTIANSGETDLSLTAIPLVQITGPHASDFTVTAQPVSPVAPAGSSNFTISYNSSAAGLRSATVVIANSDADEAPFEFAIQGTGVISTDSELSSLSLPGISLTPAFNPAVTSYTGSVPAGTTSLSLTPSGESHGTIEARVNGGSWATVASGDSATLPLNPGANTVELRVTAQNGDVTTYTFIIHSGVLTPSITSASTDEDIQTTAGLVLTRNVEDPSGDATHFKITGIANGVLYQNDGITTIADGSFITFAQGNAGLIFTPAMDFNGSAGFNVQASTASSDAGLSGAVVAASITVAPVNDTPVFGIGANRTHPYGTNTSQSFASGATGIGDGDPEVSQLLVFNVTNDNPSIFTTPPAIAPDGTLSYTPNGTAGTAVVSVSLTDDATAGGAALTTAMQTFTIKVLSAAEIAVSGNTTNIINGDVTPDTADHTDFGSLNIADAPVLRTFTITNSGETDLSLTASPLVQITGPHTADFTVTAQPVSPVAPTASTSFTIAFNSSATGLRSATVVIANSDADEAPFEFAIQGTGVISTDSSLATITLSGLTFTPAFSPAITSYTGSVPGSTTGITLSPSGSTYGTIEARVNSGSYSAVPSGGTSTTLPLNPGPNTIEVRVTAQNGSVTTYTFTITRAALVGGVDVINANVVGTYVMATAVQPDGKILIGGNFTHVLGTPRQNLARLNADGTLDATFNPKPNNNLYCISLQNDGKILIGGNFTTLQPNGAPATSTRNRIARLNADGTLDTGFDPNANGYISCILPQPDGKILIGGSYTTLKPIGASSTISRPMLARVNSDGTLDNGFFPFPNSSVDSIALQPDGRIVLGGVFTTIKPNGAATATARQYLARINSDGTLDNSFVPSPNNRVHCVALQPDEKIVLGGTFTAVEPNGAPNSAYSNYIARLNSDGSLDSGFDPNANTTVTGITLQTDGKVLLGGQFTTLQPNGAGAAIAHNRLARLTTAGTLDASFDVQANNIVYGVTLQADGKVFAGGTFTTLQPDPGSVSVTRNFFARLTNDSATQTLSQTGSGQLDWVRGGTAPEVSRVWFEQSTDGGTTWTPLGEGARVGTTAHWRITGLSLPNNGQVRARGRTAGGYFGGSSGLVETVATLTASLTDLELWRQTHFGSTVNSGDGANDNDYDKDGVVNLLEHAFGLNPKNSASRGVPVPIFDGGTFTYGFVQPAGTGGVIYQAEWSTTMQPGDWHTVPDTGVLPNHVFSIPTGDPRLFTRLRVSAP